MNASIRVGLCQFDPVVGDLSGNRDRIIDAIAASAAAGCEVAVLPELALTGYPPEDLLLSESFLRASMAALNELASSVVGSVALVGCVETTDDGCYNAVAIIADGTVQGFARKMRLPNYGVFDERRYFTPGETPALISVNEVSIGVSICEDIWFSGDPCQAASDAGANLLINCSASPFHAGKGRERLTMLSERARELQLPIAYCAMVGGQDELVFDGQSMVVNANGDLISRGPQFVEGLIVADVEPAERTGADRSRADLVAACHVNVSASDAGLASPSSDPLEGDSEIEQALVLGLRAYVDKNGFDGVVLGVSGGIDSAVAATLAVDALGSERVHGVVMPSPWSSTETQNDARQLCSNLGIDCLELPIEPAMKAFAETLSAAPTGPGDAVANENIQARIRGNLLMALSNRLGWLVITTGNKSELAVGYSTLYGDAAGGFGILKDVPKHLVYRLAEVRNLREDSPIPDSIIQRAPSAELRPGQRDSDSLPPYPILDEILRLYVEERREAAAIIAAGHEPEVVHRVLGMVDRAEYKRRQYPPGVKITPLAFGRDRRMPMTNRFKP